MATSQSCPTETDEAKVLHQYLQLRGIPHTHVGNESNGGTRAAIIRGTKLKSMGQSRGFPDFLIFPKRADGSGRLRIAIELKRVKGGRVSPEQRQWLSILAQAGFIVDTCRGAEEAIKMIENERRKHVNAN